MRKIILALALIPLSANAMGVGLGIGENTALAVSGALLEGCESFSAGVPDALNWSNVGGGPVSQSASNVTQGSFSCRLQSSNITVTNSNITVPEEVDLSGYSNVSVDLHIASVSGDVVVELYVFCGGDTQSAFQDSLSSTGSSTLSVTVSSLSCRSLSGITVFAYGTSGAIDYYVDNIRGV